MYALHSYIHPALKVGSSEWIISIFFVLELQTSEESRISNFFDNFFFMNLKMGSIFCDFPILNSIIHQSLRTPVLALGMLQIILHIIFWHRPKFLSLKYRRVDSLNSFTFVQIIIQPRILKPKPLVVSKSTCTSQGTFQLSYLFYAVI